MSDIGLRPTVDELDAEGVLELFRRVGEDVNALAKAYPAANEWFMAQGMRFEFGIVGEMYLLKRGWDGVEDVLNGPKTGPSAPKDLLLEMLLDATRDANGQDADDRAWLSEVAKASAAASSDSWVPTIDGPAPSDFDDEVPF